MCVARSTHIRGFKLKSVEVKLLAYAYDVAVFCTDLESVTEVVSITKKFCEASGAAVNWDKKCGLFTGLGTLYLNIMKVCDEAENP